MSLMFIIMITGPILITLKKTYDAYIQYLNDDIWHIAASKAFVDFFGLLITYIMPAFLPIILSSYGVYLPFMSFIQNFSAFVAWCHFISLLDLPTCYDNIEAFITPYIPYLKHIATAYTVTSLIFTVYGIYLSGSFWGGMAYASANNPFSLLFPSLPSSLSFSGIWYITGTLSLLKRMILPLVSFSVVKLLILIWSILFANFFYYDSQKVISLLPQRIRNLQRIVPQALIPLLGMLLPFLLAPLLYSDISNLLTLGSQTIVAYFGYAASSLKIKVILSSILFMSGLGLMSYKKVSPKLAVSITALCFLATNYTILLLPLGLSKAYYLSFISLSTLSILAYQAHIKPYANLLFQIVVVYALRAISTGSEILTTVIISIAHIIACAPLFSQKFKMARRGPRNIIRRAIRHAENSHHWAELISTGGALHMLYILPICLPLICYFTQGLQGSNLFLAASYALMSFQAISAQLFSVKDDKNDLHIQTRELLLSTALSYLTLAVGTILNTRLILQTGRTMLMLQTLYASKARFQFKDREEVTVNRPTPAQRRQPIAPPAPAPTHSQNIVGDQQAIINALMAEILN